MSLHSSGGGGIQILCLNLSTNIYYVTTLLLNQKDLLLKSNRTAEMGPLWLLCEWKATFSGLLWTISCKYTGYFLTYSIKLSQTVKKTKRCEGFRRKTSMLTTQSSETRRNSTFWKGSQAKKKKDGNHWFKQGFYKSLTRHSHSSSYFPPLLFSILRWGHSEANAYKQTNREEVTHE